MQPTVISPFRIAFRPALQRLAAGVLLAGLCACGGGGDSGGGGSSGSGASGTVVLDTLSGLVRTSGGGALEGVTVSVGAASALTDARGAFIVSSIGSLPVGSVLVEFDGSTAVATGPIPFPLLDVLVPLPAGTRALTMPQIITLPDLNNAMSANQSLLLNADGTAAEAIEVAQPGGLTDISLTGALGTLVTLGGMVGALQVDLNVTPVPADEVPMPLPAGLVGNSFVTIQPGNAAFDPPDPAPPGDPVAGLDIVLPDTLGLPPGTNVDIWSFDHDAAAWVNRSTETGQRGVVRLVGGVGPATEVAASGVISEGGWHTAAIPVDPACATRVQGRVVDQDTGAGIAGATIAFATGQFAMTAADGSFTSDLIPAYDVALLAAGGGCSPTDLCFEVVLPPTAGGSSSGKLTVSAADIVAGGTTVLPSIPFVLGTTGSVAGVVIGMGAPGAQVTLAPSAGTGVSVTPNGSGAFFATGLEAGTWTAAFQFLGEPAPTTVPFVIEANRITSVVIQLAKGGGDEDVSVLVLRDDDLDSTPLVPCPGATVRLQGTDAVSSGGLVMMTDANGMALFQNVSGPFTVTAQKDVFAQGETTRVAAALVGIDPAAGVIGLFLGVELGASPPVVDALVAGTVANLPVPVGLEGFQLVATERGTEGNGFQSATVVDPASGDYSLPVPSGIDLDLVVVHADFLALSKVRATLLAPDAGQAPAMGTLDLDLDFADAVAWAQPVDVAFDNLPAGNNVTVEVELEDLATGARFQFDLHVNPFGAQDVTLNLPDVTHAAFSGLRFIVQASSLNPTSVSGFLSCDRVLSSTPAALTFDFPGVPIAGSPMDGASYTVAQLEALPVSYVQGASNSLGMNGANSVGFFYDDAGGGTLPAGIDAAVWTIFVPAGRTSFDMPLVGLPMFGPGQDVILFQVGTFRFAGVTFAFDTFFDGNLATNLSTLLGTSTVECEAFAQGIISTQ